MGERIAHGDHLGGRAGGSLFRGWARNTGGGLFQARPGATVPTPDPPVARRSPDISIYIVLCANDHTRPKFAPPTPLHFWPATVRPAF